MTSCAHDTAEADVHIARLTDGQGGPVTGYAAEVRIHCVSCGTRFVFLGRPGLSPDEPRVSVDGFELRAPMTIEGAGASLIERMVPTARGDA